MVQKSVKIQDVAKVAGVSTATVSRALSNPELLSESTRDAVLSAIRTTGYRVNRAARSLRRQEARAVLVLVPNLGNPFFSEILAGMTAVLGGADYSVLITDTKGSGADERQLLDYFRDARVDGMISLDGGLDDDELELLRGQAGNGRVVFACEWVQGAKLPSVRSDNLEGARLAVQHLHELGHRKIAHITGPQDNVLTHARREGMLEERARLGLPARDEWIVRGDFSLESGQDAGARILAMEDRPTAVFCCSDQVAFGLISALHAGGLRVPEDISVIGFDDIELSAFYVPALTTIRQNRRQLGQAAAQLLLDGLGPDAGFLNEATGPVQTIDVDLVVRASTSAVPHA
ncbi:LacI family DNA-binding transcriptional regulator [Roseibium sp. CAU 1637]|uniref:LacI family DNA-binding transcriptional regulator n=1 Tax=Roseibium limicola TaxID=2816037 RepID=A0A939J400_9HYPH|nr:LacI family DNA-binding transcriptional regulator [Roseibium limicola]MBO0344225.1 LacI family DNA-binding transcriptional regulator [Roseibium limicola]